MTSLPALSNICALSVRKKSRKLLGAPGAVPVKNSNLKLLLLPNKLAGTVNDHGDKLNVPPPAPTAKPLRMVFDVFWVVALGLMKKSLRPPSLSV